MGGGVPSTTSSTTTVNQSPWQNPTYQALMLGTTNNPGPVTNILRHNAATMDAYDRLLAQGVTPQQVMNNPTYNPSVLGAGQTFQPAGAAAPAAAQKAAEGGIMNARGFAAGGMTSAQAKAVAAFNNTIASGGQPTDKQIAQINKIETTKGINVSPYIDTGTKAVANTTVQNAIAKAQQSGNYPKGIGTNPYESISTTYPGSNAVKSTTTAKTTEDLLKASLGQTAGIRVNDKGQFESTNPLFNQAVNEVQAAQTLPGQFGQATDAYNQAIAGLQGLTNYQPQQVTAQNIAAPTATASSYDASQMVSPKDIATQGYDAATMQAAQMGGAGDVYANTLAQQQMDRGQIQNIQAQKAQAALMSGPESWAQPGVAQAYMNPYVKTALASQQELANIDLQKQLNQIMGQAAGQGAFGGSRTQQALMESRRNQDLANRNMAAQALSQAYTQGMGQFTGEQQMSQSAKSANQAAINAANLNYVAQQLAAQQANQGMDYNTALQNMQAKLGVQQAQQAADLQASLANQQYGQTGFQTQAQNLASRNQASSANMQAINNQRSQYVTQALQAAQANQQAALTTEQQNMIARNAASQFNAQNATQISQANAQMNLAGQQSNQQANLAAATQNQQAGLSANQQNIGAWGQAAGAAQGLGALGAQQAQTNLANIGAMGQAASAWQNLQQQYLNTQAQNATNTLNLPTSQQSGVANMINAQPSSGGTQGNVTTSTPASIFGGKAEGGEVKAHKAWDKAKKGKIEKKGIASKGWN